jgi:hypothetical protein
MLLHCEVYILNIQYMSDRQMDKRRASCYYFIIIFFSGK